MRYRIFIDSGCEINKLHLWIISSTNTINLTGDGAIVTRMCTLVLFIGTCDIAGAFFISIYIA